MLFRMFVRDDSRAAHTQRYHQARQVYEFCDWPVQ